MKTSFALQPVTTDAMGLEEGACLYKACTALMPATFMQPLWNYTTRNYDNQ